MHPFGDTVSVPFILVGLTLAIAISGIGWFKHRVWGWRPAVVVIATQILGDLVSAFMGDVVRGAAVGLCSCIFCVQGSQLVLQVAMRQAFVNEEEQLESGGFLR